MTKNLEQASPHIETDDDRDPSNTSTSPETATFQRDEIQEVRRGNRRENKIITIWRIVVTLVLLAVAISVTLASYFKLKDAEEKTFETAFDQFSETVAKAAKQHQAEIREAFKLMGDTLTLTAIENNATWPFFTMPFFETTASHVLHLANAEMLTVAPLVDAELREDWLEFSEANHEMWVKEGHMLRYGNLDNLKDEKSFKRYMYGGPAPNQTRDDFYTPTWSFSPPPFSYGFINWDGRSVKDFDDLLGPGIYMKNETVFTRVKPYSLAPGLAFTEEDHAIMHSDQGSEVHHPHITLGHIVHEELGDPDAKIVAAVMGVVAIDAALQDLLPDKVQVTAVVTNSCGDVFTYEIIGGRALFKDNKDSHDREYNDMGLHVNLFEGLYTHPEFETTPGHCIYYMDVYPNQELRDLYSDDTPQFFAAIVACTFVLVAVVFVMFDLFIRRRNESMIETAARSNAMVTALFPGKYRDQMMSQMMDGMSGKKGNKKIDVSAVSESMRSQPLADLFLECTVLFADIAGFTAWSSSREPSQVFMLLETVYGAFDKIARRRSVFKVETIRDCYVAATGIPNPRKDHATKMCRFARDIVQKMNALATELVVLLGPDTGDLTIRVGIHSGPVTAGVLRGERARFQLFGDTVNTTSRLEATGKGDKVHLSETTADLLKESGMGEWIEPRPDTDGVTDRNGLKLFTYWLVLGDRTATEKTTSQSESVTSEIDVQFVDVTKDSVVRRSISSGSRLASSMEDDFDARMTNLIDWNTEVLARLLRAVIARRSGQTPTRSHKAASSSPQKEGTWSFLDEVVEIIRLPEFNKKAARLQLNPDLIELPQQVVEQLRHFVASVAAMYRENAFHNFEHASHVVMSVDKLMSRIVKGSEGGEESSMFDLGGPATRTSVSSGVTGEEGFEVEGERTAEEAASLHDHTYGITSDPLTQFACVLSALIHDVDHQGVSNAQLVKEHDEVAELYDNRSPAEQNSLELSWDMLMEETYADLQNCIYGSEEERMRFRQLLVNSVMATDIVDKELKVLRNGRWDKAFKTTRDENGNVFTESRRDAVNRKATIVIEHLIQASDVSHTMQHWHVYRRWNANFFRECYMAYRTGRADVDPSVNWYKGEIGFFDFYIIPLAKKLKECGVFGKSSGEFLSYALQNRKEWEERGEEISREMLQELEAELVSARTRKILGSVH